MEKIVVSIRVRPLNKQEAAKGSPWKIASNAISLCNVSTGVAVPGQSYVFDSVFGMEDNTLDLYEAHTKAIISSSVKGINGTVFAYGQTSSGKTFTMRGSAVEPGIIPMSVRDVFYNIQQADDREFLLRVSYMEIYNEEINDLLAPENRKLQVHENLERGIFVAGLREEIVSCPEQVLQLLEYGEAHRHIGETNMNLYSSRSHTIFRMVIESRDRSQDDPSQSAPVCDAVRVSVLNLVDLAGSERVAKTGAEGARLKEGSHINKSLMTLGNVINKLSEGVENQGGHVPYRDSKLTRILQPALGGNARTVIICNITPAMVHVDETKGTLQFASRAIRVTNCAQVNEIVTDAALLKRQKREIEELRNKLQESHSEHLEEEILSLRNAMLKIELERERMALELQDKAARERRMKEQIENLSTLVLNSAVDDRHNKSVKKTNRRETWCPRLTTSNPTVEVQSLKPSVPLATKRERNLPLPPPFESLKEEDDVLMKDPKEEAEEHETFAQQDRMRYVGERRHKLSARLQANEEELLDLQARFQGLHCDYEVAVAEIEKLRSENENLKAATKSATKLNEGNRRCKSLDGSQTETSTGAISELQNQVETLETEKYYMQRELDSRIEHTKSQTNSAKQVLEGLYDELKESNEQIQVLTDRNMLLEQEKEEMSRSLTQLATAFEDMSSVANNSMIYATDCIENIMDEARNVRPVLQFTEVHELKVALQQAAGAEALEQNTKASEDELTKVTNDLVMELTDAYYKLEEEKALSASRLSLLEETEKRCLELQSALTHMFSERSEEFQAIQVLEAKLNYLEQTGREREAECDATHERKMDDLHKELQQMEQRVVASEAAIQEDLHQSSLEGTRLVEELTKEKEKLAMELMDVHYKLEEEKAISASRQCDIEEKERERVTAAIERNAQAASELEFLEKNFNARLDRLQQLATARENELELALRQEIQKLLLEVEQVEKKLSEAEAEEARKVAELNGGKEAEIGKVMEDLNIALLRCDKLEEQCEKLKEQAAEQQLQNGLLAGRVDELKVRETELVDELKVRETELVDELKVRETELAKADEISKMDLENARSIYMETLDNLKTELRMSIEKCKQLEEQYAVAKEKENESHLQNEQLAERVSQLHKELLDTEELFKAELNKLLVSKTKFQVAFDAMFARAEVFEGRLEDARWELIEFRDRAASARRVLESTLASTKLEIEDLKVELEKVRYAEELQETVKRLEEQKSKLESEVVGKFPKDNCPMKRKPCDAQAPASALKMKKLKDDEQESPSERLATPYSKLSRRSNEEVTVRRSPLSPLDNLTLPEDRKTKWFPSSRHDNL